MLSQILAKLFNRCLKKTRFQSLWKASLLISVAMLSYQPSECHQQTLWFGYNNNAIDHPNRNKFLSDKQYGFRSCRSYCWCFIIRYRFSEALANKFITRAIVLDMSKAFWQVVVYYTNSLYAYKEETSQLLSPLSPRCVLEFCFNGQVSESHDINACVYQGPLLGPTIILLQINALSSNTVRSSLNIYANGITVYERIPKNEDDQKLICPLALIGQWGKTGL